MMLLANVVLVCLMANMMFLVDGRLQASNMWTIQEAPHEASTNQSDDTRESLEQDGHLGILVYSRTTINTSFHSSICTKVIIFFLVLVL